MTQEETDFCRMAKINSDCSLRAWQIFKPRFYNGQTVTSLLEDKSSFCSNDRTLTGMVEVHNKRKSCLWIASVSAKFSPSLRFIRISIDILTDSPFLLDNVSFVEKGLVA